jgi:cbb3-type cytochrome oxidase subunit 1
LVPRIRGRGLRSPSLVRTHFWIAMAGVGIAWIATSMAGLVQGYVQSTASAAQSAFVTGEGWHQIYGAVRPMLILRMSAGALIFTGVLLFIVNIQRTLAEGHDVEADHVAPVREAIGSNA